jgi:uncharacterized lipoprotein YmbA
MGATPVFRCLPPVLAAACLLLAGCFGQSPASRFYALTAAGAASGQDRAAANAVIGIGPIHLADYLDQPRIVTRKGDHQLVQADYDRWAGSFEDNITGVIAENIGHMLPTRRIYLYPWRRSLSVDYQVVLDVVRCDGTLGREAWLVTRWSVFDGRDKSLVGADRSSIREPVDDGGYAALVAAQSRALGRLCREITAAIHQAGRKR